MSDQELKQRLYELASDIAMLKNPQCWFTQDDLSDAERLVAIQELEDEMKELIG